MYTDYSLSDLFGFEKSDVCNHMMHEMKLGEKMKGSFDYLVTRMPVQKLKAFKKLKWSEGKNYNWAIIKQDSITLIFRQYGTHFTIFFRNENEKNQYRTKHGCFTFHSNKEKMSDKDSDRYVDNNFIDIDAGILPLIKLIADGRIHLLMNSYAFVVPSHVDVQNVWNGGEDVSCIDTFVFCCDEIFGKYLSLFAQTDMLEKIRTIKVGDILNGTYKVLKVSTSVDVEKGYYHDAGLNMSSLNGLMCDKWSDVYSLTRYHLNDIFPT